MYLRRVSIRSVDHLVATQNLWLHRCVDPYDIVSFGVESRVDRRAAGRLTDAMNFANSAALDQIDLEGRRWREVWYSFLREACRAQQAKFRRWAAKGQATCPPSVAYAALQSLVCEAQTRRREAVAALIENLVGWEMTVDELALALDLPETPTRAMLFWLRSRGAPLTVTKYDKQAWWTWAAPRCPTGSALERWTMTPAAKRRMRPLPERAWVMFGDRRSQHLSPSSSSLEPT